MDLSNNKIQYKTNKYLTKYNNSSDPIGKLIYGRKYLVYSQYYLEQTGGNGGNGGTIPNTTSNSNTQEHINQMILSINEQIGKIQSHIQKFNPTYKIIESFDTAMRTNISKEFKGYDKNNDLVKYYSDIVSQCEDIL
jgi:hypothetical protein